MSKLSFLLIVSVELLFLSSCAQKVEPDRQWFMYRGNYARGVLDRANLPETWDAETGENIAWKTEIPGMGHACPVVWGDNVFVTTAVSSEDKGEILTGIYGSIAPVPDSSVHEWNLYCIDKTTGDIKWEQTSYKGIPEQKRHPMSSHANCTPATNGEFVVAFFGSEGLYCYNMKGELQWSKDFGVLKSVKAGPKYELLNENKLAETLMSTPAIAENFLFFRTNKHLVAVSKK